MAVQRPLTPLNHAVSAARSALIPAGIFSLFINMLALVSPLYMLQVYDRVLSSRNLMTLLFLTIIAVFLYLVYGSLEGLRSRVLVRGGARFENVLRTPLFETTFAAMLGRKSGTVEAQPFRDADMVREFVTGSAMLAFFDLPWVPLFIAASFLLHPIFGWLAIGSGILTLIFTIINEYSTKKLLHRATQASISAHADVSATLRNSEVMRAMGMTPGLKDRWAERRDEQIVWQAVASDRGSALMAGLKSFRQIVQVLILGVGGYLVLEGELSAGGIVAASIIVGRALAPIELAVSQWKVFQGARGAWGRLQDLFRQIPQNQLRMPLPAPKGDIRVEQIVAAAPGERTPILRGVSFQIEKGDALAVIGPSAAGKSSLIRVLLGVWPAHAGTVRFDGFEVNHWNPNDLGPHIGYLPQDVELFAGTVAQNIARFREAEHGDVISAAELAGVHEMVQHMPNGYDTQIGEGGHALSGGQRQRVGLARALFGKPAIVVLDEPNANLDSTGESALVAAIRYLKQAGSTVIFVTHKTNMLTLADKVLLMEQGAVRLYGERDEVLAKIFGGPKVVPSQPQPHAVLQAPAPAG
ncbi:MAG TPA: type I secretion system permease/ATPase [Bradyrhizobium sp.]|jgi:ATP-binding cassette, subfamily C, type I secretion system permease/ATPase|nr:type I secretion system permease/ATPase [Bradyrhizobium sp.]